MTTYYYDKDRNGVEHCYQVDESELQQDIERTLKALSAPNRFPVQIIDASVYLEFNNIDEVLQDKSLDQDAFDWWCLVASERSATDEPIAVITHINAVNGRYEVHLIDNIDWLGLVHEYAIPHGYQIEPGWYREDEITREEAERLGMNALARQLDR